MGYARARACFGKVRLRFGEPLSLREALAEPDQTLEKVAFELADGCLQLHGGAGYMRDYQIERA